jgi:hypothetical protein
MQNVQNPVENLRLAHYDTVTTMPSNATFSIATLVLRFQVSLDEQHISVDIVHGNDVLVLRESALFAALLILARKRLADKIAGKLPEKEHGWMDTWDVADLLGVEDLGLNLTVCRLRKLMRRSGVEGAWSIVQRRRKKIRIGTDQLLGIEAG